MKEKMSISNLNENAGVSTGLGISYHTVENEDNITVLENPNVKPTRSIADLSHLPVENNTEGVVMKESIEEDLLGEGSIFEDYLREKAKEREEIDAAIDAHNEMIAAQLGESVPEEITDEDVASSMQLINDQKDDINEDLEIDNSFDYVDPLEEELEEDINYRGTIPHSNFTSNIDEIEKETSSNNKIANTVMSDDIGQDVKFVIDDEDLLDEDDVDADEDENEANMKELQSAISDKIAGVNKQLNISSFKINKTPISAKNALSAAHKKSVDWALFSSKLHFALSEFSGTEISTLGSNSGLNQYSIVYNRYKLILDHMIGANKPKDVESFVKSVSFFDNDDLYGGIYVANFAESNYIPYDCPKCSHTFLSENIPIKNMYSFEKEEDEELFGRIRKEEYYQLSDLYTSEIVPITDNYAFAFREPSIYSIIFETALLDEKFTNKYRDIISVISYIDEIYFIDQESQSLIPIGYKRFHNNKMKDTKSRIIEYAKIINSLSPDKYNIILAYLSAINSNRTGMKWKLPECTCPKCGTVIKERETTAENLVFTRHQLAALAITSLK